MTVYRLNLYRGDRLLGHFETGTATGREDLRELVDRLSVDYRVETLASYDEKRLVEASAEGIKVLYRELQFRAEDLT
ncbi:hypothetical protein [Stenotrophomonas sp.]|uniref:hypothetical protein n=1 Tax=Stenotrophomonas sp. TaxID=69392 RepID=UPI0031DB9010